MEGGFCVVKNLLGEYNGKCKGGEGEMFSRQNPHPTSRKPLARFISLREIYSPL